MWLHNILSLKPAKWPVGRSIRMAVGVGAPLALGFSSGHILFFLWVTLGVMMQSAGESTGSYRSLFRITLIAAPIGSLGYFAAELWHAPDPLAIAILVVFSFLAGIINSYGAAYSKGTLQALLGASLAFGLAPELHGVIASWKMAALYLCGTAFYMVLLALEAIIDKRRPQRQLLADYLYTLAAFTQAHASYTQSKNTTEEKIKKNLQEKARSAVIDKYELLYAMLIDTRTANIVRSKENQNNAAILQAGDSIFSIVLALNDNVVLNALTVWLEQLANAIKHKRPLPVAPQPLNLNSRLHLRATSLIESIASLDSVIAIKTPTAKKKSHWQQSDQWKDHLIVGQDVLKSAAILALCMGLAFSTKYVLHENHWYWVPLTVSLVMKPELGSVFVRAILRFTGTAIGVVIGAVILAFVPKSLAMVAIIMALAACLPWAMLRSYALQTLLLTPLVLILIDLTTPGLRNVDYAAQRLIDTAIGGAIVLIFGYFIWPRSHEKQLATTYKLAMSTLADYFELACAPEQDSHETRRLLYSQLSNLRAQLQKQLSEPSPADKEAAKWFPIIASAERLADNITIYIENKSQDSSLPKKSYVEIIVQKMLTITEHPEPTNGSEDDSNDIHDNAFLDETLSELNTISRSIHTTQSA